MTQPPNVPNGQPFDPNKIPTDPQQAAAWAQQQQAAVWQQQQAAWQQQAAQEAQEEAHQEYLEQQAAEATKSSFGPRQIISIVVGVVVVAAAGWGLWQRFQSDQALQVGKCVVLSGTSSDAEHKEVDCAKEDYSWKVATIVDTGSTCPDDTVSYTISQSSRRGGASKTVKVACLAPNFQEGKCYSQDSSDVNEFAVAECTTGNVKVLKAFDNAAGTCENPDQTWALPTANKTYCMEQIS